MRENIIASIVVDEAFHLHKELGPGLLECVYELLLADMLRSKGLEVVRQQPIPIRFRGRQFEEGFRADLVVEDLVLVEIKSIAALAPIHKKLVLTYLKLSHRKLGILVNFGGALFRGNVERLVNGLGQTSGTPAEDQLPTHAPSQPPQP